MSYIYFYAMKGMFASSCELHRAHLPLADPRESGGRRGRVGPAHQAGGRDPEVGRVRLRGPLPASHHSQVGYT